MRVINEISSLTDALKSNKFVDKHIGLVPTMGALHDGHLELINSARKECDVVICSIYVNPTQFNNALDLEKYPRSIERDITILEKVGCDIVFCPRDEEIYSGENNLIIDFGELGNVLEGKFRPGHFNGVGLIVAKLFNMVQPDSAFFGQKDLQQFAVINSLVKGLNFNIELRCVATVRNENGLALSSRNARLTEEGIQNALIFYEALTVAKTKLLTGIPVKAILDKVGDLFEKNKVDLDYFVIVNKNTFSPITSLKNISETAICVAGSIEGIRLIDNMLLN